MKIEVTENLSIEDLQKAFENHFKFLRLMFFKKPHGLKEGSAKKDVLAGNTNLSTLISKKGSLSFDENTTVNELEIMFKERVGLNAQVFRKSGKTWIETTVTDNWSLKKQNEQGKELSELSF